MKRLTLVVAVSACFIAAPLVSADASAGPILGISLVSQPGDYLGQGRSYFFDASDVFSPLIFVGADLTGNGGVDFLDFFLLGDIGGGACGDPMGLCFMDMSFGTNMLGTDLVPGTYTDAQRAIFAATGHPGLDVGLNGRGCNTSSGSFTIEDVLFASDRSLIRFVASFEQHCEGGEPALFGRVSFDNSGSSFVPEPSTYLLFGTGVVGLLPPWLRRRRHLL